MTIRVRRQDDVARCVQVLGAVHSADGYPLRWPADPSAWLAPANLLRAWVAEDDGRLLGHMALCSAVGGGGAPLWSAASSLAPERLAVVSRLFVAPSARGHGIGAALLAHACAEAGRWGLRPALEVLAHDQNAIALYDRAGWRRVASVPAPWARTRDSRSSDQALLHYYLSPN
jgi:GNAT superfamily N-acetyltransferase